MKKLFLSAALLLGAFAINAQTNEGSYMIGGTIANFKADFGNSTSLTFTPRAAKFVSDGLAIGGYANFGFDHTNGANTIYKYGVGPMARYYLLTERRTEFKKFKFMLEANTGFDGTSRTRIDGKKGTGGSTNGLGFGFGPGISYFISPNIGLEALVKYNGIVGFGSDTYSDDLTLAVGFQIYLSKEKANNTIKTIKNL